METERRALTEDETHKVFGDAYPASSLLGMIGQSLGAGVSLVAIAMFAGALLAWITGYEVKGLYNDSLAILTAAIASIGFFAYFVQHELRGRRNYEQRRTKLKSSNDLIVERHEISNCLFVREPEHGHPMYFLQTDDDTIIFILEGQDELDDDWEQYPLKLKDSEKPRADLKLIRDPETKLCLLEELSGQALPVRKCHIINLGAGQWPSSGNIIKGPWETLSKRYRLEQFQSEQD